MILSIIIYCQSFCAFDTVGLLAGRAFIWPVKIFSHQQSPVSYLGDDFCRQRPLTSSDCQKNRPPEQQPKIVVIIVIICWSFHLHIVQPLSTVPCCRSITSLEQPAVESHVAVVTDQLQASFENRTFYLQFYIEHICSSFQLLSLIVWWSCSLVMLCHLNHIRIHNIAGAG